MYLIPIFKFQSNSEWSDYQSTITEEYIYVYCEVT